MRPLRFSWGMFYVFLFLYRSMFSVFTELVVMRLTNIGDTRSYQMGSFPRGYEALLDSSVGVALSGGGTQLSTSLTTKFGAILNKLLFGNPILIDIGFQAVTWIGLVYLLNSVDRSIRLRLVLFVMFPSFTIWTSIASKEAIVVACVCILTGYVIRMYYHTAKLNLFHIAALLLLGVFKGHYLIAFAYLTATTALARHVRQKALLALIGGLISLVFLYVFRDRIDFLAVSVQRAFLVVRGSRSTRLEAYFVDQYDVFLRAPVGMAEAFIGPRFTEILTSPLHIVTFTESMLLIAALAFFVIRRLPSIPIYSFIMGGFTVFWIMFPNYPFGIMNPGSAIRYRTGWMLVVIVVLSILMSRDLFLSWRDGARVARRSIADAADKTIANPTAAADELGR